MRPFICSILLMLGSSSGAAQQSSAPLLDRFIAAFNARNADVLMACVSDSITWLNVSGDSVGTELRGKPALKAWLLGYFRDCPSCRSEFLSVQNAGRFISVHEKASWKGKSGERSQRSLSVYEIENGAIRRVWYFPSEQ